MHETGSNIDKFIMLFTLLLFALFSALMLITLNMVYATLALLMIITSKFYALKVKKGASYPPRVDLFYYLEFFGVALMLLPIIIVGYRNCVINILVHTSSIYIWLTGISLIGIGEFILRTYEKSSRLKRQVFPEGS
jgi:magnesium-transporting ATPase (P-type)